MNTNSSIYVAGRRGMVGSAIWRQLKRDGFVNLIGRTRQELDLLQYTEVKRFYETAKPDYVFVAAAKVGGIAANAAEPASYLYDNLHIQNNFIHGSFRICLNKFLFFLDLNSVVY